MFNEWNVVLTIMTLIAFVTVFVKISMSYQQSMTKLSVAIDSLQKTIDKLDDSLLRHKEKVYEKFDKCDKEIACHETEIKLIKQEIDYDKRL